LLLKIMRADDPGVTMEQVRRVPLDKVRQFFEQAKFVQSIPEHARFKPYRIGWRGPYTITHGTTSGYSQGCRCEPCKKAATAYHKARREKVRRESAVAQMRPYVEGTALALAGGIPALVAEHRANNPVEDKSENFNGMNILVGKLADEERVTQGQLDAWFALCQIRSTGERVEWLMQSQLGVDERGYYKKSVSVEVA